MMTGKFFNFRAALVALLGLIAIGASAQVTVKGTVVDPDDEPIIGATVREDGTNSGTSTDIDGNFTLSVKSGKATLVVSYIGMQTQKVAVNGQSDLNIKLKADGGVNLDEVVVVGYGTQRRTDVTGSVASLSKDQMKESIVTNADQMLQGKIAGVQVTSNSGAPGAATSIRIRGASSINSSNEPLYIIGIFRK